MNSTVWGDVILYLSQGVVVVAAAPLQVHPVDQVVPVCVRGQIPLPAGPPQLADLAGQPHGQEEGEEAACHQGENSRGGGFDLQGKQTILTVFLSLKVYKFTTTQINSNNNEDDINSKVN